MKNLFSKFRSLPYHQKAVWAFLFFALVILTRNFLETAVFSKKYFLAYFVVIHHFFWYLSTFLYYSAIFKYISGLKRDKVPYLAFATPIVWIPLLHSFIVSEPLKLEYLRGKSFSEVMYQITILMYGHPTNHHFFYEILLLLIGFFVLSWMISKSVVRTILSVVIGYYGSIIVGGLHLFGVFPTSKAFIRIHTSFRNHQLMALIFYTSALTLFIVHLYPDIKSYFTKDKVKQLLKYLAISYIPYLLFLLFGFKIFYKKSLMLTDNFLLISPYISIFFFFYLLKEKSLPKGFKVFLRFFAVTAALIFFPLLFGMY